MDASTPRIEPGIAPLVEALNAWPEMETFASCQGHPWRGERPYVAFRTLSQPPVPETIRFLHDLAQQVERAGRFDLRHSWTIQGGFHPEYGLVFVLEADGLWRRFWWRRSKVRQDIDTLTKLLRPPTAHSTECTKTRASAGLPQSTASAANTWGLSDPPAP